MIDQKELNAIIREVIDNNCYLKTVKNDSGEFQYFEYKIDTNWDDKLSNKDIEKILDSDSPYDTFYDLLNDCYWDCELDNDNYIFDECIGDIREAIDELDLQENVELDDYVREYIQIFVLIKIPYDHYLGQKINVNISTNFYNESNTDFTCNSFYIDGIQHCQKLPKGSITWLVNSQGYTMKELYEDFTGTKKSDSVFIRTVSQELENATYSMQLLTFFVKMSLEDIIEWKQNKKSISISRDYVHGGLYNPWNGSCSCLEIELEKPITIQEKNIYSLDYDGALGYGVDQICGLVDSFWQ